MEINNTQLDAYNLTEYIDNSKTSERLWQYYRVDPNATLVNS